MLNTFLSVFRFPTFSLRDVKVEDGFPYTIDEKRVVFPESQAPINNTFLSLFLTDNQYSITVTKHTTTAITIGYNEVSITQYVKFAAVLSPLYSQTDKFEWLWTE